MIDLTPFEGIIFDMDGTLVDSMGAHVEAWKLTCEAFGYPFDPDYLHRLGGVPTLQTVELMNLHFHHHADPKEVAAFKKQTFDKLAHIPTLISDTVSIFNHYVNTRPIAVGTGSDRNHAQWVLSQHDLLDQLDALVTADDVTNGKPHPETFLLAAEKMNIAPERCVVFEDTEMGQRAALDAGMQCIMVNDGKVIDTLSQT